jgi:transposase
MIHLPASVRVYLCLTPCDMRKSFDSLQALVREQLELDAFAGHLFVFTSRRKDRVKILYWGVSRTQGNLRSCIEDGRRPPGAGFRNRLQIARSCCVEKAWW